MARPRQFEKLVILAAARDEFARRGFEATSLDDLMRVTGLGKGSIYGTFGDKRQLFLSALQLYCDATLQAMHDALSSGKPAIEKLRGLFRIPDLGKGSATPYRGCFLANSTTELAAHDQDVEEIARLTYRSVEKMLVGVVTQAQKSGDLSSAVSPAAFGRLMLAIMQGMEFLRKAGTTTEALRGIAWAAEMLLLQPDEKTTASPHEGQLRKPKPAVKAARTKKK